MENYSVKGSGSGGTHDENLDFHRGQKIEDDFAKNNEINQESKEKPKEKSKEEAKEKPCGIKETKLKLEEILCMSDEEVRLHLILMGKSPNPSIPREIRQLIQKQVVPDDIY